MVGCFVLGKKRSHGISIKGARTSEKWTGTQIIGILPDGEKNAGNEYLDIIIPSGIGLTRNSLVVQTGDVCIAISGGAGTLSEIALETAI